MPSRRVSQVTPTCSLGGVAMFADGGAGGAAMVATRCGVLDPAAVLDAMWKHARHSNHAANPAAATIASLRFMPACPARTRVSSVNPRLVSGSGETDAAGGGASDAIG